MRCRWAGLVLAVLLLAGQSATAQSTTRPAYVPNQLVIRVGAGTTQAELASALDTIGAKMVRPVHLANTYLVELIPTRGATVDVAVTRATSVPSIVAATPNYYFYREAVPNDPRWSQLWGMRMINAPKAWDVEKGKATVVVAVVDDGISPTHPDLQGRLLAGTDIANGDNDPSYAPTDPFAGHAVHVSGTIAAQGNNSIGVVGVCWDGVKILPVKIFADFTPGASLADVVDGLDYAMQQGVQVVNMSFGGPFPDEFVHDKIRELYAAGIILVASAGNDSGTVGYPAGYEECIAVSALKSDEGIAFYSNFGPEIDIGAPGGDGSQDTPEAIWSTVWQTGQGDGYAGWSGTSMAAPHVSGAAALLISAGVSPSKVTGRLYRGARAPKSGVLDPRLYGHGVLDVYGALHTVAEITIVSPSRGQILDTTTPTFKVSTYLVRKESIKVYLDYQDANKDGVPDDLSQNIVLDGTMIDSDPDRIQYDASTGTLTFQWPVGGQSPLAPGTHTLYVSGDPTAEADPLPAKDYLVFFIQPHVVPAGRHLFSVPYPLPSEVTPYQLFGTTNFRLARFVPLLDGHADGYAKINYPGEADNPLAWPANPGVHPDGETVDTPPAGLGFWLDATSDLPIVVDGVTDKTRAYDITLTRGQSGWNMIGDPFPFAVPWESVKVSYQGRTLALKDAIAAGWIRAALYRYTTSGYTFLNPPDAVLVPWEGHWVRILPNNPERPEDTMTLIVPPLGSGAIVGSGRSRAATSGDEWSLRLVASAGGVTDSYNIAGISSRAAEGFDTLDAEKPPSMAGYVQLSFVHRDWGANSGLYASDFRSSVGTGKTWEIEVTTDMASKDVTITWPDVSLVSKKYALVIEDLDGSSKTYMRTRGSYTYNSGATPGVRHFRLRVTAADAGPMLLANVVVSQTRGSTVSISYTVSRDARVEVRLRDAGNRVIRSLGGNTTRAVGINSAQWDCRLDDGRQAPSGLYLAEIIATSLDGEVAKAVRPILVR
jgi:subtilisin family serine protease